MTKTPYSNNIFAVTPDDLDATAAAIQRWACAHTPPTGARDLAYVVMGRGMLDKQTGCICIVLVVSTRVCAPTGNKENMVLTELLHQTGAGGEVNVALTVRAAGGCSSGVASRNQGDCNRQTLSSALP